MACASSYSPASTGMQVKVPEEVGGKGSPVDLGEIILNATH
jgi:hypothetical protein